MRTADGSRPRTAAGPDGDPGGSSDVVAIVGRHRGENMSKDQPAESRVAPQAVFNRSNMPSWWERLTGVSPKYVEDKVYLSFVAARYRGEERLPHPRSLVAPDGVQHLQDTGLIGGFAAATAIVIAIFGLAAEQPIVFGMAVLVLAMALAGMVVVWVSTAPEITRFKDLQARCAVAHARLYADPLDADYRSTLDTMITCDEGTLAYCAAKIAAEIRRDTVADTRTLDLIVIDLWDELAAIGTSAREIAEDRAMTESLARSRLRGTDDVRDRIATDQALRDAAIGLLAARVSAFADYRDRLVLLGADAWRESRITGRAMRLSSDELAATQREWLRDAFGNSAVRKSR